ncbi:Laminin-like protein epi-1 [Trichinella pseudospiralis]|uniref:Laminin-like protein epi-1 n=1 Tax=Trichinella pseudospiralis TaxID=6337 RepID=A0A0V1J1Q5_TRIPS|nr:Laminin-like protein epi-1 [Trichinella pseudospiralis]
MPPVRRCRQLFVSLFWTVVVVVVVNFSIGANGQVLNPPYFNLAEARKITATATCGVQDGQPIRELYCSLAGATRYSPYEGFFSYNYEEDLSELRVGSSQSSQEQKKPFVQGGQNCEYCDASSVDYNYPAENMVDGTPRWWQSPPLSRGMQYNQVNITIDLEQEFHVAYVSLHMANSPRPGLWVLERSTDHGKTFMPWQYFAETSAQCEEFFGPDSLQPIMDDDSVICSTEYSQIVPLENGQIFVTLLNNRPGRGNFSHSDKLQLFTRATNVRIRLLRTKTLQGHLMDLNDKKDPTITRRYFYSIKEIEMGGRCVCNGHAQTCDILDPMRPNRLLCRCEHNTCGDQCDRCCPGFEQKQWQPVREGQVFACEPCNCHGHSDECEYDEEVDMKKQSLDIHGKYEGGGVCKHCQHNTEGINCDKCKFGYFRPPGRPLNAMDVCIPCQCDSPFFDGNCAPDTGKCFCKNRFQQPNCDACSFGHYNFPECKPCECFVNGTTDALCSPDHVGHCHCKENFGGLLCRECRPGYFGFPACQQCDCDVVGSRNQVCNQTSGHCSCLMNYEGARCDRCRAGYFGYPKCDYCNCHSLGTTEEKCDPHTGRCLCKPGFTGQTCGQCMTGYYGLPECKSCNCSSIGSLSESCHAETGQCQCRSNFGGLHCDRCSAGHFDYPHCKPCECNRFGSLGTTCDDNGQCFCKANFVGQKCDRCKQNFFNYPLCEECNCDPRGVSLNFSGCDKVPKGDLCICKSHVTGRRCNECQRFHWNLQYHNVHGCEPCRCNPAGTLSSLTDCDHLTGQCYCKSNVFGRDCSRCKDGFYALNPSNPLGCKPCQCDSGGSFSNICDPRTGQCFCKPRVGGRTCSEPIEAHFYPTLQHLKYEAEDAVTADGQPARFAVDEHLFPDYSWKGYAVFSPIQDEIHMPVDIPKSSVYRILLRYQNPTQQDIAAIISMHPIYTHSNRDRDVEQSVDMRLAKTALPSLQLVPSSAQPHPFVLNPGQWLLKIKSAHRLLLDYVVFLPEAYFGATSLHTSFPKPCLQFNESDAAVCEMLIYPKLSKPSVDLSNFKLDGQPEKLEFYPAAQLPVSSDQHLWINSENLYSIEVKPEKMFNYTLVIDYYNFDDDIVPADVEVSSGLVSTRGSLVFHYCPYSTFCREVVSENGQPLWFETNDNLVVNVQTGKKPNLALKSVTLIPSEDWDVELLQPQPQCIKMDGRCVGFAHLSLPSASRTEVESVYRNTTISGYDLPFLIYDPEIQVIPLNISAEGIIHFTGSVPKPDKYVFVMHYYSPVHSKMIIESDIRSVHNDTAYLPTSSYGQHLVGVEILPKCIGLSKCSLRKWRHLYPKPDQMQQNTYLDYVLVIPITSYSDDVLYPVSADRARIDMGNCSKYLNQPSSAASVAVAEEDEQCKQLIFSLTVDFNVGAISCDCNLEGSTSFVCERYGGQCSCKPNVIGRQCTQCKPGYFGFPNCKPCACGPNRMCDERTGYCFCPPLVEGSKCERCQTNAYGYDALIGCQQCACSAPGTQNQATQCDQLTGQCLCVANVGGRRCDRCLAGHYGYPHCYQCACDLSGSTAEICDQNTAACSCKEHVIGSTCASCSPGTFNLEMRNPKGCTECFCFGVTAICQSANFAISEIVQMNGWKVLHAPSAKLVESGDHKLEIFFDQSATAEQKLVYMVAPYAYSGNRLLSFGGKLFYTISAWPSAETTSITVSPDLILKGNNVTLEYWNEEQPSTFDSFFFVEVDLLPERWTHENGEPVTRAQLMTVLHNVTALLVKASYYTRLQRVVMKMFTMTTADSSSLVTAERQAALNVEICRCPPPYKGTSCEECAEGFYRVNTGPFLGSCVPCKCHGHSKSCDPRTGLCLRCEHNTAGDHCEQCQAGFYGDATFGSPMDCQLCPCPLPTVANNFAHSCQVNERGRLLSCNCTEGYAGDRCNKCAVGWFGEPSRPDGRCQRCFCNNNNQLTKENSCDSTNGRCFDCENNTDGFHCELCAPWYYGDAVHASNCTECSCNQCGSDWCDADTGQCQCKTNVVGDNCDHCADNAWGFNYCQGCQMCNCAEAATTAQCDMETGQCVCQPGVAGLFCERCADGFWNYSASGCRKCDCESDLAMGTICDPATGQCQCMEGATGTRCDQCLPGHLLVPYHGCLQCDECVVGLVDDFEQFGKELDEIENSTHDLSVAQISSKRLDRLNRTLYQMISNLDSLDNLTQFKRANAFQLQDANSIIVTIKRSMSDAEEARRRAADFGEHGFKVHRDIRTSSSKLKNQIKKLEAFAQSLESNPRNGAAGGGGDDVAKQTEQLKAEVENFLSGIKDADLARREEYALAELENSGRLVEEADHFDRSVRKLRNASAVVAASFDSINQRVRHLLDQLEQSRTRMEQAEMSYSEIGAAPVFENMPNSNISKTEQTLAEAYELTNSARAIISGMGDVRTKLQNSLLELNKSGPVLAAKIEKDGQAIGKIQLMKEAVLEHSDTLDSQVRDLEMQFADSRQNVGDALQASRAYRQITDALANASRAVDWLSTNHYELLTEPERLDGLEEEVKEQAGLAMQIVRQASEMRAKMKNQMRKELSENEATIANMRAELNATEQQVLKLFNETAQLDQTRGQVSYASVFASDTSTLVDEEEQLLKSTLLKDHEAVVRQVDDKLADQLAAISNAKRAKANVEQIRLMVPELLKNVSSLRDAFVKSVSSMNAVEAGVAMLKEKLARARDLANKVKLGVRFYPNSTLQLYNFDRLGEVQAQTQVQLYFRTHYPDGLLFFLGNDLLHSADRNAGSLPSDDYLALEIADGYLRATVDLGAGPTAVQTERLVSDGRWHKATVERVGKLLTLTVSTDHEPDESVEVFSRGTKSILNLHQNDSKLFVGGVPDSVQLPPSVSSFRYSGQIEALTVHGEPRGLWNFVLDGRNNTYGAPERKELLETVSASGSMYFTGSGYILMQKDAWNARQENEIIFYFKTYSSMGLLFYMGKERDFFAIEMKRGQVRLHYNLGSGAATLVTPRKYNDGQYHRVHVKRDGRQAVLSVGMTDTVEGNSPGKMSHLDVTDEYYVGGVLSSALPANSPVIRQSFHGCIERMQINGYHVNLNRHLQAYFAEPGCPSRPIRSVAFDRPGSSVKFSSLTWNANMELSFKFRTMLANTWLLLVSDEIAANTLSVAVQNGFVVLKSKSVGSSEHVVKIDAQNFADGIWHYVSISKIGSEIKLDTDDLFTNSVYMEPLGVYAQSDSTLHLGAIPISDSQFQNMSTFVGCIGDVTYNGRMLNFADSERYGEYISFNICPEDLFPSVEEIAALLPDSDQDVSMTFTTIAVPAVDTCALQLKPIKHAPCGGNCFRFGTESNSRLEFQSLVSPIDARAEFSLELRTNTFNGLVLYASDKKKDYTALYLKDGKLVYEYDSGSGSVSLQSKQSILDYQWHYVKLYRDGRDGQLWIDDILQAEGKSPGLTTRIDLQRPFYIGGLPNEEFRSAKKQHPTLSDVAAVFSGCMRNILLNNVPMGDASNSVGVYPCDNEFERGIFFGEQHGYFVLDNDFMIESKLSFSFEIKPRSKNAILFVIASGDGSEFITLQMVDAVLMLSVEHEQQAGQRLKLSMKSNSALCDGHWHSIRVLKVKNFVTIAVDGNNAHMQLKKRKADAMEEKKHTLYVGGLPENFSSTGLLMRNHFVGCMRSLSFDQTHRRHRHKRVDLRQITVFGDVSKEGCPVD